MLSSDLYSSDRIKYLIKMVGEWRLNPSVHRAKGDRLVCARMLPICDNAVKMVTCSLEIMCPRPELEVIKLEYNLKLKIKRND